MSLCPYDGKGEGKLEFSWGRKRAIGSTEGCVYYESFTYDGEEYFLYDSVYLWRDGELEPYIGKIVNMWETTASHKKSVQLVWFLRPGEVQWHLRGLKPQSNELFLASGEGLGLSNVNCLEAISGKCHVVCTSEDKRNPIASEEELRIADFIFRRTFNVQSLKISEKFPDVIAGHKVEHFFNQRRDQKVIPHPKPIGTLYKRLGVPASSSKPEPDTTVGRVKEEQSRRSSESDIHSMKKRKLEGISDDSNVKPDKAPQPSVGKPKGITDPQVVGRLKEEQSQRTSESANQAMKKRKLGGVSDYSNVKPDKAPQPTVERPKGSNDPQIVKSIRKPFLDSSTWFKLQTWEERLQKAHANGSLILLENLDPSYSSSEVEEVVSQALDKKVSAKMISRNTFSSPHNGQALVIFKSKNDADFALSDLNKKCLMLGDAGPVMGRKAPLRDPGGSSKFVGHLEIEKLKFQRQHAETRDAVSTSHCSQPNTVEYEMAMEWRLLQERANIFWHTLHKQHSKEIADLNRQSKAPVHKQASMYAAKNEKPKYR